MNQEIDFQRSFERQFRNTTYVVTIRAVSSGLLIEAQDKHNGEFWEGFYDPKAIEHITSSVGNLKRYSIFVKMFLSAINMSSQTVMLDIKTHRELESQSLRRHTNSKVQRTTDPKIANKIYIILEYMGEFDKVLYPLPLHWNENPDHEKLKQAIRRLSSEIKIYEDQSPNAALVKQLSLLKRENEILKSRNKGRLNTNPQYKQNYDSSEDIKQKMAALERQHQQLKTQLQQQRIQNSKCLKMKNQMIEEMKANLAQRVNDQNSVNELSKLHDEKCAILNEELEGLQAEVRHLKQNDRKSNIKIRNLEQELSEMIQKRNYTRTANRQPAIKAATKISAKKSDASSVKSISSRASQSSLTNKKLRTHKATKSRNNFRNRRSVMDSDTESSRMRKMSNNRASPYRQSQATSNRSESVRSTSAKKVPPKYNNISNIYKKTNYVNVNRNRSRSKSKSVKRNLSPQDEKHLQQNSLMLTDDNRKSQALLEAGYLSDQESDSSNNNTENTNSHAKEAFASLRNRRKEVIAEKARNQPSNQIRNIESKIASIANTLMRRREEAAHQV